MAPRIPLAAAVFCFLAYYAQAADYHVDNVKGNDAADGQSPSTAFRTIAKAIATAKGGDTIHLTPTGELYRESADFYRHPGGAEAAPLILDGHGVTLSGSDPCPPDGWKTDDANGLVYREDMVSRIFLLVDGAMVFDTPTQPFNQLRPGEFCWQEGRLNFNPPPGRLAESQLVEVQRPDGTFAALNPKSWQISHSQIKTVRRYNGFPEPPAAVKLNGKPVKLLSDEQRLSRIEPGQWGVIGERMHFKPPTGKTIGQLKIECVVRSNGVQFGGNTAHVTVRNLNATHVYNDGYNIHGDVRAIRFENCNAHQCGDEGFSSHDTCETFLDGAVYTECDNGIFNVNQCKAVTRNVICARNRHVGFGATHETEQTIENLILVDNPSQFTAGLQDKITADNLLIVRTDKVVGGTSQAVSLGGGPVTLKRFTALGNTSLFSIQPQAKLTLESGFFGPGQGAFVVQHDDPSSLLTLKELLVHSSQTVQWGGRTSWKTDRLSTLSGVEVSEDEGAAGCSSELRERLTAFLK